MAEIKASDVAKLRKMTGAGMMDCKQALSETNGDFDQAIDILRKKGRKIVSKRAGREASEGVVIAKTNPDHTFGILLVLNCETDFVAKNEDFIQKAHEVADLAIQNQCKDLQSLKELSIHEDTVDNEIINLAGITGEKVELSYFASFESPFVVAYIHPGNRLATLVNFNKKADDLQVGKDVAMQVAAMNPIAVDKDRVSQEVIDKELEIGREQAIAEGKPEQIVDKIAQGKLGKYFKENTLLNQDFIKDHKIQVKEYLAHHDKELTVNDFYRFTLNV